MTSSSNRNKDGPRHPARLQFQRRTRRSSLARPRAHPRELLDWRGSGMSVMEMSHRSREFESIIAEAEQRLRRILAISDDYAVVFLQGGGSMQFTMAPMNLCLPGKPVDVLHTGMWDRQSHRRTEKRHPAQYRRLYRSGQIRPAAAPRRNKILPRPPPTSTSATNNTIEGTQWSTLPNTGNAPLVADMSSDIASHAIDVNKFGLIYAGAQKNLGPSGTTIAIIRKDLAERADKNLPTLLQYRTT